MSKKLSKKPIALAVGAAFALGAAATAQASVFQTADLGAGYMVASAGDEKGAEGKCGEGKCGEDKKADGKCGEGKCGEGKKAAHKKGEGKCGEGKCGEDKKDGGDEEESE